MFHVTTSELTKSFNFVEMAKNQTACQYKGNFCEHFLRHEVDQEIHVESTPNGNSGGDSISKKKPDKPRLSLESLEVNTLKAPGIAAHDTTRSESVVEDQKDMDDIRHIDSVLECSPVDAPCNGCPCENERRSPRRGGVDDEITCDCSAMPST